jgi:ABC-type transporter Mla MlaB component
VPALSVQSDTAFDGPRLQFDQTQAGTMLLHLVGDWKLKRGLPTAATVERQLGQTDQPRRLSFDAAEPGSWDSGLLAFLVALQDACRARGVEFVPPACPKVRGAFSGLLRRCRSARARAARMHGLISSRLSAPNPWLCGDHEISAQALEAMQTANAMLKSLHEVVGNSGADLKALTDGLLKASDQATLH